MLPPIIKAPMPALARIGGGVLPGNRRLQILQSNLRSFVNPTASFPIVSD